VALSATLQAALAARGIPRRIYVDNGSAFIDAQLLRACASLGIQLVHSQPGKPAGRGKIERAFRTVREQFLIELGLREAFLWSQWRTVTKTATVSLHGNVYEVDAALVGRKVELVFDPFDLTRIEVRYHGRPMGQAIPHRIGRHVHRKARPDAAPPAAAGIYAGIVAALGGVRRFHRAALIPQTADALAAEDHERGRLVVLVIDEAHLLDADQLEELRLLSNADMDSRSPFGCLLVGQPTLRRRIKLGTFAALDQRIALRYAMAGMNPGETKSYLAHHLKLAGRSDTLISDDAAALIHQVSRGLPRAVNNLAIQALVAAFAANKTIVDESSARAAVTEVTTE
jgi:hypothetical protein